MTMTSFTCDDFSEHLADHLEGDASRDVTAAMDAHAAACASCATLARELAAIAGEAAALPELMPARDLWSGIAARIEAPAIPISTGTVRRHAGARRPAPRRWWAHPALAAAALVGVTAGITYFMTKESIEGPVAPAGVAQTPTVAGEGSPVEAFVQAAPSTQVAAADASPVATAEPRTAANGSRPSRGTSQAPAGLAGGVQLAAYRPGEIAALDSLYYREIIRLRQLLDQRSTGLDSTTVAVIDRNMLVIDRAIQECREALAADPASKFLNQQLNQALETKIELLRTAAMMPVGS